MSISLEAKRASHRLRDIEVEFEGEWRKLDRVLEYIGSSGSKEIKRDIAKAERNYLNLFKRTLVNGLLTGGTGIGQSWEPHGAGYYSPTGKVGIRTGNYLRALQALRVSQKNYKAELSFTTSLNVKSKKRGLTLAKYAVIFEYGRAGQPARSLWGATYFHLGGRRRVVRVLQQSIVNRLKRFGVKGIR